METARGFNKKNGTTRVAEFDGFLSVNDRVNILIADTITTLPAPIVQGPAGLLRNTARKKSPGAVLGGCVPQQHENINIRQRIVIYVVKLAVVRLVGLVIESGIGFNKPNTRRHCSGKHGDALQIVAHDGKHIARSDEVEERRVFHTVRFRKDILKKTSVGALGLTALSGTFGDNFLGILQDAIEVRKRH